MHTNRRNYAFRLRFADTQQYNRPYEIGRSKPRMASATAAKPAAYVNSCCQILNICFMAMPIDGDTSSMRDYCIRPARMAVSHINNIYIIFKSQYIDIKKTFNTIAQYARRILFFLFPFMFDINHLRFQDFWSIAPSGIVRIVIMLNIHLSCIAFLPIDFTIYIDDIF